MRQSKRLLVHCPQKESRQAAELGACEEKDVLNIRVNPTEFIGRRSCT